MFFCCAYLLSFRVYRSILHEIIFCLLSVPVGFFVVQSYATGPEGTGSMSVAICVVLVTTVVQRRVTY